jgi:YegS/Rv2252/BmrU family lipid kinase
MLVIVNAKAGTTDQESVRRAVSALRAEGRNEVTLRECADLADLNRALDQHRADQPVIAAGGDGSIHRLVNTLSARGELAARIIGLLPLGTGNDLARNLGIPLEPEKAAHLILAGRSRPLDLLVDDDGRVALNAVHIGIGAAAAESAARFKPYVGTAAFPIGAILAGIRTSGWRLRIEADGSLITEDKLLMVALNNASGIAGGNAQLAPGASPHDGRLELTASAATGPLARIGYALSLRTGSHRHRDDVHHGSARTVTVSGDPFPVNTDGEVSGPYRQRTWTLQPHAWKFLMPPTAR